jgi:hypothetical protein
MASTMLSNTDACAVDARDTGYRPSGPVSSRGRVRLHQQTWSRAAAAGCTAPAMSPLFREGLQERVDHSCRDVMTVADVRAVLMDVVCHVRASTPDGHVVG